MSRSAGEYDGQGRGLLTVEQITGTADGYGQIDLDDDGNWSEYIQRPCKVQVQGGREFYRGGQIQSEVTHIFGVRHDSETRLITSKMRCAWNSKTFEIVSVNILNEDDIDLFCKSV